MIICFHYEKQELLACTTLNSAHWQRIPLERQLIAAVFLAHTSYPSYNRYHEQVTTLNNFIPIFRAPAAQHEAFIKNSRQWPLGLHCACNPSERFCSFPSPQGYQLSPVRDGCPRVSTCGTVFQLAVSTFIFHHTPEGRTCVSVPLNGWLQWPHAFKTLQHSSANHFRKSLDI